MPTDLILYVVIAGGLVFWLKNILGTRHGEERDRSDRLTPEQKEAAESFMQNYKGKQDVSESVNFDPIIEKSNGKISIANDDVKETLQEIARNDKGFDFKFFTEAVQDVFVMVVEAFGKADRELLEDLLAKDVYKAFDAAIDERNKAEETLDNEIHAIHNIDIIEAKLEKSKAFVTIRFIADEVSVTRDNVGGIIAGHPEKISEMRDIWTFSRDLKSRDPRWFVNETRGDFEGDNETIPNSE